MYYNIVFFSPETTVCSILDLKVENKLFSPSVLSVAVLQSSPVHKQITTIIIVICMQDPSLSIPASLL